MGYKRANTKMKKIFFLLLSLLFFLEGSSINIIPSRYETVKSHQGIIVKSIIVNENKTLTVIFSNENSSNYNTTGTYVTYSFDWYLSYKGKRISDYFTEAIRCGKESSRTVIFWPGEVPDGYEKYISVQLGRELRTKDRRDDF